MQKPKNTFKKSYVHLYSPFRFGEKNASAERGEGNDEFGKYIALCLY